MLRILLISAGAILETLFIMRSYRRRDGVSVFLKTAASLVFVLLGLLELRRTGTSVYGELVVAGLTLGMLGDLLLALRYLGQKLHHFFFAAGSVSFFLGHVVYIAAILTLCPQAWTYAIPIAVVALGAASFYAYAKEVRAGKVTPLGAVYIASVLFMTACAATGRVHQLEPGAVSVLRRRRMLLSKRQYAGRALLRERRQPVPQRRPARAVLHGPDLHRPDDRVCVKRPKYGSWKIFSFSV